MKTVRVFIERGKDGSYGAYMPDDNDLSYGLTGDGDSAAAAVADFKAVYEGMKEYYKEEGEEFEEVEFTFSYDIPSFLRYYSQFMTFAGLSKLTGISAAQLSQYVSGYRNPTPRTSEKILKAFNTFGRDLCQPDLV